MDIRQLRYFIAIVEERTVSAAAKRLHLSQPPLSQQLKAMESELGTRLVERSGKYLEVTDAGNMLYAYALQMVQLMDEAAAQVKEAGSGARGRLSIGVNTFSVAELPEILHLFQQRYPKVTYQIHQNESARLCRLVRDREVELAFVRLPLELDDDLSLLHLYDEPFYWIASEREAPFGPKVSLAELENVPLMLPSTRGLGVHYLILRVFSQHRLEPRLLGECSDISLLMSLVSSGFCGSIVPATLLDRYPGYPIQACQIDDAAGMSSPVGLLWLKHHRLSPQAQHFIELLQAAQRRPS
ncbi:LysR family transcriptional regulator [Cohnella sp. REN36]|uniref:LysR family transcriptional regulator n=1 Tax=Cohnella sp. REN36 TaxID=2887347 RepID=UPI001D138762|nr:LysR family transcriptional regulator [Cohnella sp. REN36]MCC3377424.1 LysR family transcriptional regulator [Cohnella sp. REN36]